ncbi:MAG TPA: zf-HC2 domain-containing protein [Vicinamibacteria bacterium]|nr:zf-HC2 domain-containing protein [Vicinamibacteria bacterium]
MSDEALNDGARGCDATRITGYVDGVLPDEVRAEVESHLVSCPPCREQEAFERGIRDRMRALPAPEMRFGFEQRLRRRLRRRPVPRAVRWLPLAAVFVLAVGWGRGAAPFVAWELARDHAHCFAKDRLPAEVWTSDPGEATEWYGRRGTELPLVPHAAGGLELVGGRFCPLLDRRVAHLYYGGEKRQLSVFIVPGPARFEGTFSARVRGENVRLLHSGGVTVGLVSEDAEAVEALHRALSVSRASSGPSAPHGLAVDQLPRALVRSIFTPVGL